MLCRVELCHFKNHRTTTIDFNSHFSVIVGRNGSGKSAILDAIEWCLFHSKFKELRASSHKDLMNVHKKPHEVMAVEISLRQNYNTVIQLRREFNGTRAQMSMRRIFCHTTSSPRPHDGSDDLSASPRDPPFSKINSKQLHDVFVEMRVPHANLNRILIKQSATSIATASSKNILEYIESIVGTDMIKMNMDALTKQLDTILGQQHETSLQFQATVAAKDEHRQPLLLEAGVYSEAHSLYSRLIDVVAQKKQSLQQTEVELKESKQDWNTNIARLSDERDSIKILHATSDAVLKRLQKQIVALENLKQHTGRLLQNFLEEDSKQHIQLADLQEHDNSLHKQIASKKKKLNKLADTRTKISARLEEAHQSVFDLTVEMNALEQQFEDHIKKTLRPCSQRTESSHQTSMNQVKAAQRELSVCLSHQANLHDSRCEIDKLQKSITAKTKLARNTSSSCDTSLKLETRNDSDVQANLARQEQQACESEITEVICEFHNSAAVLKEINASIRQLKSNMAELKVTGHELQADAAHLTHKDHIRKSPREKFSNSLYSRYSFCKSLLHQFNAQVSSQKQQTGVVCDMLVDRIQLTNNSYSTAVKAVLGAALVNTIVVGTRGEAILLSQLASQQNHQTVVPAVKTNISIIVVDELPHISHTSNTAWPGKRANMIPLLDAVTATSHGYDRALHKKLHSWNLFLDSDCKELVSSSEKSNPQTSSMLGQLQKQRVNLVTVNGQIFLADGEVRSSSSSRQQDSSEENVLDALLRHDAAMLSRLNADESNNTFPAQLNEKPQALKAENNKLQFDVSSFELNKLENELTKHTEAHVALQLKLEICNQHRQFMREKWKFLIAKTEQADGSIRKKLLPSSAVQKNENIPPHNLPDEETLLIEFNDQYSDQKLELQRRQAALSASYTSTNAANKALRLCQEVGVATARVTSTASSSKRLEEDLRRQENEIRKVEKSLTTQMHEQNDVTSAIEKLTLKISKTTERKLMMQEDVRCLREPTLGLSSEEALKAEVAEKRVELRQLSVTMKKLETAERKARHNLDHVEEDIMKTQLNLTKTTSNLELKRDQSEKFEAKSAGIHSALNQDPFTTSSLNMETIDKLSREGDKYFSTATSPCQFSQRINSENDVYEAVTCKSSDMKHILAKEAQLITSEGSLQQQLDLIQQSTRFSSFQTFMLQCEHHCRTYTKLLEQEITTRNELHDLSETRFDTLLTALDLINHHLDHFYSSIVPSGSCYLDYPRDKVSLFDTDALNTKGQNGGCDVQGGGGIRLRARHGDDCTFREVFSLSGGQTAAVGLALLMSLQQCYPSPFVIMDEVDAALDTSTTCRVGQLLRSRRRGVTKGDDDEKSLAECEDIDIRSECASQFIVVSHRPEMQVWADEVVGVYISHGFPDAVSVCFDSGSDKDIMMS